MRRREFVVFVCGALALRAETAASQDHRVRRVGILAPGPLHPIKSFKDRLLEQGWVDGEGMRFDERWGGGDDLSYPRLAAELVALPVDLLITWGTPATPAAKRESTTIPIVMASIADPVGVGAVSNLARPGGNVTGFSTQNLELEEKRLELLRELVPGAIRIVALGNAGNPYVAIAANRLAGLAAARKMEFQAIESDTAKGMREALVRVTAFRPDAVLIISAPALFPHRSEIVEYMAAKRLPAVYPFPEFAEVGGLICYATDFDDLFRRAADYVDKILRVASVAELPVQQASAFKLVVNVKAAHAIGLSISPAVLARATEVIE